MKLLDVSYRILGIFKLQIVSEQRTEVRYKNYVIILLFNRRIFEFQWNIDKDDNDLNNYIEYKNTIEAGKTGDFNCPVYYETISVSNLLFHPINK